MNINFAILALAAIVPLLIGFIWYHPKVMGSAWMTASNLTEEQLKGANMLKIFSITYLLSFLAAMSIQFMVIHQYSVYSVLANEPGINDPTSPIGMYFADFMQKYGSNFRTFKHGLLHGTLTGVFLVIPIIGITAMFERKGFKYIAINAGYWIISFMLMGGIICAFA
ncbi:MAG: DUF1761 domain-containing protein [Bacteroidetes bacterium]|nr:DUF1761 domain-containing protein [Bacteroidota bacterium]